MAALTPGFRFSQASLATAEVCPRRFYLRYLARVHWPAAHDPGGLAAEQGAARGRLFHHLLHQHHLGLDVAAEVEAQEDPRLSAWWQAFLEHPPSGLPAGRAFAEVEVWVPLEAWWLRARFDRVVAAGSDLCIVDWKTGAPPEQGYLNTWQTLVYAYVATEGGGMFGDGGPVSPEQVALCYWQATRPAEVWWYRHNAAAHLEARARIVGLAEALSGLREEGDFARTEDEKHCRRCEFRAYCGRGSAAGSGWGHGEEEEGDEGLVPPLEPWV